MAAPRFGKLYENVGDAVIASDLTANALRLFIWCSRYIKSGDKLQGIESSALESWIESNAPGLDAKAVQVVQFSHRQSAVVFNGSRTESGRQIKRLVESGVLQPIGEPSRGHCQLFVVCPGLHTSERVQNDGTDSHTSERVQDDKGDLHTSDGLSAHIDGAICTHAEAVNSGNVAYPDRLSRVNPSDVVFSAVESTEKTSLTSCPECGKSAGVRIADDGMATCSCGTAWKVKQ